jgi:RNA polymerase sigma-70 factor, ECF subfamily
MQDARDAVERVARASYGRLIAYLSVRSKDIAIAEDALSEAFATALRTWPSSGIPDRPEAWLLTTARRTLGHGERSRRIREGAVPMIELAYEEAMARAAPEFPDERLKLLFVCSHPDIEAAARTPLMLQAVLGLDAVRIAAAFLTSPAAMSQRLVRAKARIREAALAFEAPETSVLASRCSDVLSAIYAAYGTGWDAIAGADEGVRGLAAEAVYLARLTVDLMPEQAEAKGLLALILYCEARRAARRDGDGEFVPLDRQDASRWSRGLIVEAEALLVTASRAGAFGRFQTEAAIQSVHVQQAITGVKNTRALMQLYDFLAANHPSLGALVSRAAVYADGHGADVALRLLDELPPERIVSYQPYWVARSHILHRLGCVEDALAAQDRAVGLTEEPAVRTFLRQRFT